MKNIWIWVVVVIVIIAAIGGYLGRRRIKAMLGMTPSTQVNPSISSQPSQGQVPSGTWQGSGGQAGSPTTVSPTVMAKSSAMAPSDNIYKTTINPVKGTYLTDFQGMTIYTFDNDTQGVSNCYDQCATLWPPYTSGATAQAMFPTNISVITRKDGSKQFAWKGMPLYYYAKDQKAGDSNGDGVGGVWHLVKP